MELPENGTLLRIFIGETDKHNGKLLYEAIVSKAKELNLAGATVFRGILGFGAQSRIHTAKFLRLSEDEPVVIEIVDKKERIEQILPFLNEVVDNGLITIEEVKIFKYAHKRKK